jgi:type IV secretory pathway VirB4 component
MLRLDQVIKPWKDSAALNDHINLYGFWNETAFLTKSGDLGMVLSVPGVDYESLDRSQQEYAVKRLEAALKAFGPGFHVSRSPTTTSSHQLTRRPVVPRSTSPSDRGRTRGPSSARALVGAKTGRPRRGAR